jgi:hypothetical protein
LGFPSNFFDLKTTFLGDTMLLFEEPMLLDEEPTLEVESDLVKFRGSRGGGGFEGGGGGVVFT